ncbi:hypothetical protein Tco_0908273 [Tanacetum coccineum]|uniref:Uncharacterized protein n=1 Tax=Tanacetum coccineum TaxID=301880 RepID=A0ABQ5CMF5_9ASTR
MKPSTTPIPPPSDDRERDEIAEVTLLCLTMHKTTLAAKARENVAKVWEKLMEEDIEKMVDDVDEESYASEFANSVFLNDEEDFGTRLEFRNHKENPETVDDDDDDVEGKKDEKKDDDDDDNDDHIDYTLQEDNGSFGIQDLCFRQELLEYMDVHDNDASESSQPSWGNLIQKLRQKESMKKAFQDMLHGLGEVNPTHAYYNGSRTSKDNEDPSWSTKLTVAKTNELIKEAVPRLVNVAITRDREIAPTNVPELISQEFANHAPKIIGELFKSHMKNIIYAVPFPEEDLEEKMNRWVQKEFKTFNEEARLSIRHWKDSWHKRMYKQRREKGYMYLVKIVKFCDATLERVLKEVKLKIFETEFWKKASLLGELDLNIMKAFERETTKHLRHRELMRRWESFVNGRPILPPMKRQ